MQKKPPKSKQCLHCNNVFIPKRTDAKYCSNVCKDSHNNNLKQKNAEAKRKDKEINALSKYNTKFNQSTFAAYLIHECRRAGTAQILESHTSESLKLLRDLCAKRTQVNGSDHNQYCLSHIFPVSNYSSGRIGLLHPENLVLCDSAFNRARRNNLPTDLNAGLSIKITDLKSNFNVTVDTSKSDVLKKIKAVLGKAAYNAFLKEHHSKLGLTSRNKLFNKFNKDEIAYDPSSSLEDLLEVYRVIYNKDMSLGFSKDPADIQYIVLDETKRLKPYSPYLPYLEYYCNQHLFWSADPIQELDFSGTFAFVMDQALKYLHSDHYSFELDDKSLISFFRLRQSLPSIIKDYSIEQANPVLSFLQLLDEAGYEVEEKEPEIIFNGELCPF